MGLAGAVVAALCTLAVHVNVEFDPSISATSITTIAKDEAAAIWSTYDVDLQWTGREAPAALSLDVIVTRSIHRQHRSHPVLGETNIYRDSAVRSPIVISFDAVEAMIESHPTPHGLHDFFVARALGRVLAHELGHVLLGRPGYHDPDGLMRASFIRDDLTTPNRARFRLSDFSRDRLRTRLASWSDRREVFR